MNPSKADRVIAIFHALCIENAARSYTTLHQQALFDLAKEYESQLGVIDLVEQKPLATTYAANPPYVAGLKGESK